jgi:hypothetical protein
MMLGGASAEAGHWPHLHGRGSVKLSVAKCGEGARVCRPKLTKDMTQAGLP